MLKQPPPTYGAHYSEQVIVMASKDEKQVPMELEGAGGDGDDAELVLAMVTSPSLSSSDAGAILLGLCMH